MDLSYFFTHLLDTSDFLARWDCGIWQPFHGWLHIFADVAIFAAYLAIPIVVGTSYFKQRYIQLPPVLLLFGGFILACGALHFFEAMMFWHPLVRVSGIIKGVTAILGWLTVLSLISVLPKLLTYRPPEDLARETRSRELAEMAATISKEAASANTIDNFMGFTLAQIGKTLRWPLGTIINCNTPAKELIWWSEHESARLSVVKNTLNQFLTQEQDSYFFGNYCNSNVKPIVIHNINKVDLPKKIRRSLTAEHLHRMILIDCREKDFGMMHGCLVFWLPPQCVVDKELLQHLENIRESMNRVLERQKAEEALHNFYKATQNIQHALDESSIVAITNNKGEITFVNERFCEISQYSSQELLGKTHRVVNSGHHSKTFFAEMWRTIQSGKVWHGEICNKAKDGTYYWVDTTIVPFMDEHQQPYQYVAIRHDITPQKTLYNALKQRDHQRDLFIATLTHDLKTPIHSEFRMLEHFKNRRLGPITHEQESALEELGRANQYLAQMVNNLLTTYQYEEGKTQLKLENVCIQTLFADTLSGFISRDAQEKNQHLQITEPDEPITLCADILEIQRVFYNILQNAIQHSPEHATIEIEIANQGHHVAVHIKDCGPGISAEDLEKLFQPYTTLKTFRKVSTGLGLYLSKQIIEAHHGRIEVSSKEGEGSCFTVILPVVVPLDNAGLDNYLNSQMASL